MPERRHSPLDKILGRLEDLDPANLAVLVQRLARERGFLENVFNIIQEGILVINERGVIDYSNEAGLKLTGLRPDELGSTIVWKLLPDLARTLPFNLDRLSENSTVVSREIQLTYPELRYVRFNMFPLTDSKAQDEIRFAIVLADITEEKSSTDQLIESERIRSIMLLAAGVAHELGNPLNSLNIHLQLIKRDIQKNDINNSERLEKAVDVCADEVNRLDSIIKNFLGAIKSDAPNLADLNLISLLEEVLSFLDQELRDLHIETDLLISETPPDISADKEQIRQVLFNVIKNAMEAMDSGGSLRINTKVDDEYVYILFADTGVGIGEDAIGNVFQPYYTTKSDGHGLGMMIVQRIMHAHGGHIGIDSREGTGTIITLQFPLKERRRKMLEQSEDTP